MNALAISLLLFAQEPGFPKRVDVDNENDWPKEGRIVVEGVYSLLGDSAGTAYRRMELRICKAPFMTPRSLLSRKSPTGNIEVTGVVEMANGKRVVQVEDFTLLDDDPTRFEQMITAAEGDPEKLYAAAEWAKRRFKLYKSEAMKAAVRRANEAGLLAERKNAVGDPQKLSALKNKLDQKIKQDPDSPPETYDFESLVHEIVRAEFDRVPRDDHAALMNFADFVQRQLPGAKDIGDAVDPRHRNNYDAKPLATYDGAEAGLRRALERYFYSTLIDKALAASFQKDGAAPFELAETAKKKIPEYREVARRWFRQWAKTQEGRLVDLEAGEASETARIVADELEDFAFAAKLRSDWLDAREAKIRKREKEAAEESGANRVQRDADAWFELAKQRLAWFKDSPEQEAKAVKTLEDVLSFAPQFNKAELELRNLGYIQSTTGWRRKQERERDPKKAGRSRAVAVNMTAAEVLDALGKPTYRSRMVTATGATVVWIYRSSGGDTLVVLTGPAEALRVSKIQAPNN